MKKRLGCLILVLLMLFVKGCVCEVEEASYFVSESIECMTGKEEEIANGHDWDSVTKSSQTLCPQIEGISSIRIRNPQAKVIVDYNNGDEEEYLLEEDIIDITYITKSDSKYQPCIIISNCNSVYVYDENMAKFYKLTDDFLFYLEIYQGEYYYVNTEKEFVDSKGNIYFTDVVGVKLGTDLNHTTVYIDK